MKDILVTGAGGGMGRAAVEALRAEGFRVFALDIKSPPEGEGVIPIEADLTDEASVLRAFDTVKGYTDSLFGVLHFAGIYMLDSLVEMGACEFRRIFEVNLYGAFLVNKHFLPLLSAGSRIVITTSELAPLDPLPFTGIYAVTKGALDKYAYSLRMELQLRGVFVSVLRAGAVDTGMLGASTYALSRFCERTQLYSCNADRFRAIVERVEARCIPPRKLAAKALSILKKKKPGFAYAINRNPLLRLLGILPKRVQFWVIKRVLT
jgi:NAD(P)-dependent dehydrogenase (short-subunit alcohol dehydrogenase family)